MLNPSASSNPPAPPFIYSAANAYATALPYTSAVTTALWTPGSRVDKVTAGGGSLGYWLGFQEANKLYTKTLERFYEKHPRFAEQVNQHPILLGIPMMLVGALLSGLVGSVSETMALQALQHPFSQEKLHTVLHSEPGNIAAEGLRPLERFANHPGVKLGVLGVGLAFSVYLLGRLLHDLSTFGTDYQQARKQVPYQAVSPYELGAQVLRNERMGLSSPFTANSQA